MYADICIQYVYWLFPVAAFDFLQALCSRKGLKRPGRPNHHYHQPTPPPPTGPRGFKHPNQLKERGVHCGPPPTSVRKGEQEGLHSRAVEGNNITPSVTSRFIFDGMKYSSQNTSTFIHRRRVLAYPRPEHSANSQM